MRLVIVESPKKARTIQGFLGSGYRVAASMGHVRDLPAKGLGVDVAQDFAPQYEVLPRAGKTLSSLHQAARGAESVLLATDPDREGEAIAWHLAQALRLPKARYQRIAFHEISRRAIQEALAHPRDLDPHLIDAQQARRVLDRLVGYGLSPLLWRKVRRGTSAGRVQSVAVKLIVDREREIQAFVPTEYWTIDVRLCPYDSPLPEGGGPVDCVPDDTKSFLARLIEVDGKKADIPDQATADSLVAQLEAATYTVRETSQKTTQRNPFPPFTTSTLQQAAGNRLRFPAKKTMSLAQSLYEAGLITYMRTDSVAVSAAAMDQARSVILSLFGPDYVPAVPRHYATRTKNAQEAHEAIRPVDPAKSPASLRAALPPDEYRLYDLIWKRLLASQMPPARYLQDIALIDGAAPDAQRFLLKAAATTLIFPGWLKVYGDDTQDQPRSGEDDTDTPANDRLPPLEPKQPLDLQDVIPAQHFTQPPRRYTEPALVKALEDAGVGRPSTYATVVSTIQDRGYVQLEQRHFVPTELGFVANDFLVAHFPGIVDLPFTAQMEDELDDVAGGRRQWTQMLYTFYTPFSQTLTQAQTAPVTPRKRQEPPAGSAAPALAPNSGPAAVARGQGSRSATGAGFPVAPLVRATGRAGTVPRSRRTRRTPAASKRTRTPGVIPSGARDPNRTRTLRPKSGALTPPAASAPSPQSSVLGPCPQCGKPLVQRTSEYGPFLGCSGYPGCRYIHRDPTDPGPAKRRTGRRQSARPKRPRGGLPPAAGEPLAPKGIVRPRRTSAAPAEPTLSDADLPF